MRIEAQAVGVALALALSACATHPPAPPSSTSLALTWAAPSTYTDGKPIVGTLTYGVYLGACGDEKRVAVVPETSYSLKLSGAGCAYVTAIQDGRESATSRKVTY